MARPFADYADSQITKAIRDEKRILARFPERAPVVVPALLALITEQIARKP